MADTDKNFFNKIITGDEIWCFAYDPETQRHNSLWAGETPLPPKNLKFQSVDEYHWMHPPRHAAIQLHTFASYALPRKTPFRQTAPLLSYVVRQQNLKKYWREGSTSNAISPTSASDVVGQHNKI
jgi:hypothetical protein